MVVNFRTRILYGKGIYIGNYIVKGILLPPRGEYELGAKICLRIFINSKTDFKISYILFSVYCTTCYRKDSLQLILKIS